ncbi:MAG TPA: universal stress protein [Solirubrobacteraceae bacterium]|nr:universal stress protein [Solirubrobacteraceae bacterium]
MRALVWISEGSWEACVDRTRETLASDAEVTLLHVAAADAERLASEPLAERLGRHRPPPPGPAVRELSEAEAQELLAAARARLRRAARTLSLHGRAERVVVQAAADADLLVLAREGHPRLGPGSLGPRARFVVDHAPCEVLLVWPARPEAGVDSIHWPRHMR